MTTIPDLITRLSRLAETSSLCGVSVIVHPSDLWTLTEYIRSLEAERNVLKETLEHITYETDNFSGIEAISIYGESVLKKLYTSKAAPTDVIYPVRQE